ncbi:unnamed protein product, partial [Allacma fusca]
MSDSVHCNLPGAPHRVFVFLFAKDPVKTLKEQTLFIQNVLLVVGVPEGRLGLYERNWNLESLVQVGEFDGVTSELTLFVNVFSALRDYEGNDINGMVCAHCSSKLAKFKATGIWDDFIIAAMYDLALKLNASLELESVFQLPSDGIDEEGNFDDFTQPLIDGIAAFSAILKPSTLNRKYIFTSKVVLYDGVGFIHTWPRKYKMNSVIVLKYPFSDSVWLATLITIGVTFVLIEGFIFWRNNCDLEGLIRGYKFGSKSDGDFSQTIYTLLSPMLDQNGLANGATRRRISDSLSRILVGVWFLILIVLSCAYKSRFISFIVLPQYISPPTTFQELVDSDYKIGATFFTNYIDKKFAALKNRIGEEILRRAHDEPYFSNQCYHSIILEKRKVCIGFTIIFETLANEFLTSVNNKPMFIISKETLFPGISTVAIAKNTPYLVEPYDHILGWMECTGLWKLMFENNVIAAKALGRATARSMQNSEKVYRTNIEEDEDSEGTLFALFTLKILYTGFYGASALFI